MAGRPPVPTAVKLLRGTHRADRANHAEPSPKLGAPRPRPDLPADVKVWYRALVRALRGLRVLATTDRFVLELTASALAEHAHHTTVLAAEGSSYTTTTPTGSTMHRARPEVQLAAAAWSRALAGLVQLGMTPSARTRVRALPEEHKPDWFEKFLAEKRRGAR